MRLEIPNVLVNAPLPVVGHPRIRTVGTWMQRLAFRIECYQKHGDDEVPSDLPNRVSPGFRLCREIQEAREVKKI